MYPGKLGSVGAFVIEGMFGFDWLWCCAGYIYICGEHLVPAVGFSVQFVHHEPLFSPWVLRAEKVDGHCIKHSFEGWATCCG